MKKVIGVLLLFVVFASSSVFAQKKGKDMSPSEKSKKEATQLGEKLGLDDSQKQKVEQASLERINNVKAKKDQIKNLNAQIKALKEENKKYRADYDTKMKSILSSDQYTKWQEIKEARKENKAGKGKGGKGKGKGKKG